MSQSQSGKNGKEDQVSSLPVGRFLLGLLMLGVGGYLLMNAIQVTTAMSFGSRLYGFNAMGGQYGITTGMIMIPFLIGVGVAFYDYKKVWGWLLAGVSLASMIIGVITSVRFVIRPMSSFEFIVILVLVVGGIGLMIGKKKSTPQD